VGDSPGQRPQTFEPLAMLQLPLHLQPLSPNASAR
jgi:hypothetical protein